MRTTQFVLIALALLTAGAAVAGTAAAESQELPDCVPTPASTNPKDVVDYATYIAFFWDPDVAGCLG